MQLSKNFSLEEFYKSTTARARGIDNQPPAAAVENLRALCTHILQPLRDWYGKPIRINSGYRCPELNKAVGGSASSHHCLGSAADISGQNSFENAILFAHIKKNFSFTQLIDEKQLTWVHVSYIADRLKNQVLKIS